jgi:hypothetical protein
MLQASSNEQRRSDSRFYADRFVVSLGETISTYTVLTRTVFLAIKCKASKALDFVTAKPNRFVACTHVGKSRHLRANNVRITRKFSIIPLYGPFVEEGREKRLVSLHNNIFPRKKSRLHINLIFCHHTVPFEKKMG